MGTERDGFYRYWGKAGPAGEEPGYHLLPYHCLDVAAVGRVLLREQEGLLLGLAGFLGVHADALRRWLAYLLAIHDVGKFADGFQNLRPDLMLALQGRRVAASYDERHDTLGYRFCAGKGRRGPQSNCWHDRACRMPMRRTCGTSWLPGSTRWQGTTAGRRCSRHSPGLCPTTSR